MGTVLNRRGWRHAGGVLCCCAVVLAMSSCSEDDDSTAAGEGASGEASAAQEVSMVGTWTGHRERIASTEGYREGTATLVVTEQTGLTFEGTMDWSTPDGTESDPLVGAYTSGGSLMAGADDEGLYTFELVDATTLDYCYAESGDGFRTTCARLEKQE